MIIHNILPKMKNNILQTCLQMDYRDSLGEFSNASYAIFGVERVWAPVENLWERAHGNGAVVLHAV